MKKHHWHVFRHEKLFEKQPLPHSQTHSKNIKISMTTLLILFHEINLTILKTFPNTN